MFGRIRWRLTMGYVGILALILLIFGFVVVSLYSWQVTKQQNELLERRATSMAKDLSYLREGQRVLGESGGFAWIALTPDATVTVNRTSEAPDFGLPIEGPAREAVRSRKTQLGFFPSPEGDVWVASARMTIRGQTVGVLQYARSPEVVRGMVRDLVFVLTLVGAGALVLAAVGGLYMSRRAMRPVRDAFERQRAFIADASHELKTPLTLIRADAEVLSRGAKDPDDAELFDDLLGETDRMSALLSDLLTLARLDAGKLAVARVPFSLVAVITETTERFAARAEAEGKRLEVRLDDPRSGKLLALGDAERAAQILAALLDNALRFTPPGGLVAVEGREAEKGRVEATVADTGPGVPPADLPRVFDRFYRAEESRTRGPAGGGTGLGLAIARDLARAQSGDLSAENTPDGAYFTLTIPAAP
jgi:signal transduction histidine kinase